jgi:hypothetical protein
MLRLGLCHQKVLAVELHMYTLNSLEALADRLAREQGRILTVDDFWILWHRFLGHVRQQSIEGMTPHRRRALQQRLVARDTRRPNSVGVGVPFAFRWVTNTPMSAAAARLSER